MLLNRLVKRDSTRPTFSSVHATFLFLIYQIITFRQFSLNAQARNKLPRVVNLIVITCLIRINHQLVSKKLLYIEHFFFSGQTSNPLPVLTFHWLSPLGQNNQLASNRPPRNCLSIVTLLDCTLFCCSFILQRSVGCPDVPGGIDPPVLPC